MFQLGGWYYSPEHGQLCQVIEVQTLWGETTCHVWLPGRDSVVRIPVSRLKSLESAGIGLPGGLNFFSREELSFQEQLDQKAQANPDMVALFEIQVKGGVHE